MTPVVACRVPFRWKPRRGLVPPVLATEAVLVASAVAETCSEVLATTAESACSLLALSSVVDASTLVAAVADAGPIGRWAEETLHSGGIIAPQLVLVEATNILRRLELSDELSRSEATGARRDLLRLEIELFPFAPFAGRIWELRSNLTAYDAWYVAIAEALEALLATLDRRLARSSGPLCPFLLPD